MGAPAGEDGAGVGPDLREGEAGISWRFPGRDGCEVRGFDGDGVFGWVGVRECGSDVGFEMGSASGLRS